MRIELCDAHRRRIGRVEIEPAARPTRASVIGSDREVFLNWDAALDDSGHLRKCVVCGCSDVYRVKSFPQITGVVVLLAFAGAIIGALGLATPPMLIAMVIVLVADIAILVIARERLVCYRCRSSYRDLPIARYHRAWDRATAERYPGPGEPIQREERSAAAAVPAGATRVGGEGALR